MKGIVYKITCMLTSKYYIGSTIHTPKYRMKKHRSTSKEEDKMNSPFYTHFRDVGWENANIQVLYELEFQSKQQLLQAEKDEIIKHLGNELCLNRNRPCITPNEKKQSDIQYGKRRRTEHIEKERERVKTWRENNPDKYRLQCQRAYEKRLSKQESTATDS